ncbi:MAG: hypothetical protein HUU25_01635 [Candidatus Sumerlaeia bacterium]|nr:hypothetical protein [Candidatus Sumerlaeia bacterium]
MTLPFRLATSLLMAMPMLVSGAPATAEEFAGAIERAHGIDAWRSHRAVEASIEVIFGGETRLHGVMTFETQSMRVRIDQHSGTRLVFDGDRAWVSPGTADFDSARFHLLTWPYFLAVPFKLRDPGTHIELSGERDLGGVPHPTARLTFDPGVGDAPDDWYLLYRDPGSDLLHAMAYIVTYYGRPAEGEEEVHAIVYDGCVDFEGVTLSTRWRFHDWSEAEGIRGDPIGHVRITRLRFVDPPAGFFDRPADAREDPLPAR